MIFIEQAKNISFPEIALLEQAVQAALAQQGFSGDYEITLVLTDDAQLHKLNRDYLGMDSPTDVLSFPSDETDPETGLRYLGDILLSLPRAALQAEQAGHSLEAESQLLVVHGVLHLLGHDHADTDEKTVMWAAQAEILETLGLTHIQVRDD